jgi:hypothetical protein
MTDATPFRKARFQVGDRVRVVGPTVPHRQHATGQVCEVIGSSAASIYRYRVLFENGAAETFFGFELEPEEPLLG